MSLHEKSEALLSQLRRGDRAALGELYGLYRDRLWRMVYLRLDRRLGGRVDADDILQDAFLDAAQRIEEFLDDPAVPVYVWFRFLTVQRLLLVQRNHLGTQKRDASREVAWPQTGLSAVSADSMVGAFVSRLTSPSQAAMRHELQTRLREALNAMDPLDREVLALRHFEELSNQETAQLLGISKDAASKRHLRALQRLKEFFEQLPGGVPG